jgi:DNA-binding transcriptional ArsR family regulator
VNDLPTDEAVFKALADRGRRALLDALFEADGRTLGELCEVLPAMTRFGVMKHLAILEEAGLVVAHRSGRSKLHYLNPVPIREIEDRWIAKYAQPTVDAMVGLRRHLESDTA